jgi:hypothetical protein
MTVALMEAEDLELSPVGDGHGVDQFGFNGVAGVEVG